MQLDYWKQIGFEELTQQMSYFDLDSVKVKEEGRKKLLVGVKQLDKYHDKTARLLSELSISASKTSHLSFED